jgi:cyclopropane fatty-acyl-phospholipid synthase-like methyltransferase
MVGDLKVGDELVQLGGRTDRIVSLEHVKHFGKVYNVFVRSADPMKNVVVTGGYLNGTAFYQNEGAKFLNRRVFQGKLTNGVFSK